MYMTSREEFLGMDLAKATNNWDEKFIYDFLINLPNIEVVDLAIQWIILCWEKSHHLDETYSLAFDNDIEYYYQHFNDLLDDIRPKLEAYFNRPKREEELRARLLNGYSQPSVSIEKPQETSTTNTLTTPTDTIPQTDSGVVDQNSESQTLPVYHMADLPQDVRDCFTFDDDETYSLFVNNMRTDTWLLVRDNKGKYLDRLRFVSNKFGITGRNTTRTQYDKILHYVIPDLGDIGNLESAMKKQSDTMVNKNYAYYDSPVYSQRVKCLNLIEVGLEIEECLTPVLEKINNKKWDTQKNPR